MTEDCQRLVTFFVSCLGRASTILWAAPKGSFKANNIIYLRDLEGTIREPDFGTLRAYERSGYNNMKALARISIMDVMMLIAIALILSAIILPRFS
jgi:hypothetical protein